MKSKLVRDKIPEIIVRNNGKPVTHVAENKEYWLKLKEKLEEETQEFLESEEPEELADILEVINSICKFKKIDNIEEIRLKKKDERGGFGKRIILDDKK